MKLLNKKAEAKFTLQTIEWTAILNAIASLPNFSEATIFTDSQYCIGVFSNKYHAKVNTDLIKQFTDIVEAKSLDIHFSWVRGHNGDKWNEIVDKMANDEFEKASGCEITDFKRLKTDAQYRKQLKKSYE